MLFEVSSAPFEKSNLLCFMYRVDKRLFKEIKEEASIQ